MKKHKNTQYLMNFGMIGQKSLMYKIEPSFAYCVIFQLIEIFFDCLQRDFKTPLSSHNKIQIKHLTTIEAS